MNVLRKSCVIILFIFAGAIFFCSCAEKADYTYSKEQLQTFIDEEVQAHKDGKTEKSGIISFMDCNGTYYFEEDKYVDDDYDSGIVFSGPAIDIEELSEYINENMPVRYVGTSLDGDPIWEFYDKSWNCFRLVVTSNSSGKVTSIDLKSIMHKLPAKDGIEDYDSDGNGTIDSNEQKEFEEDFMDLNGYYSDELRDRLDNKD